MDFPGQPQLERSTTAAIEPGLYVLRYVESESSDPPVIQVRAASGSEHALSLICPPRAPPVLAGPGSALVVLAERPAILDIFVQARAGNGSLDAQIRIEPLHTGIPANEATTTFRDRNIAGAADARFTIIGHVARRGDVSVEAGDWLAGPEAPSPIEGLEIVRSGSNSIDIDYQVLARGTHQWSNWVPSGHFAGTRGQAAPLAGIRFRLSGPAANDHIIKTAALFLGSAVTEQNGQVIELRSHAGWDPLVGLRLEVVPAAVAATGRSGPDDVGASAPANSRVRVFRADVDQR